MKAIILAGGQGRRLHPYTAHMPKPMMPVGDMPILEILLRRLRCQGVADVTLAVNHLAALIMAFFGTGERWGMNIAYARESEPLGTAGPIGLVEGLDDSFVVLNGDLLTDLDIHAFLAGHRRRRATATIATCEVETRVESGVIETDAGGRVRAYVEKPTQRHRVSMGAYLFEPRVRDFIPSGRPLDIPQLIARLLEAGEPVAAHHHDGYWLDIGRPEDYARAQDEFPALRERLLGAPAPRLASAG